MKEFIQTIIQEFDFLQQFAPETVMIVFQVLFCLVILKFISIFSMAAGFFERRIAGRIQSRVGPNRVGPQGILQSVADGLKVVLKEDVIPALADEKLFRLAPYFIFIGMFLSFVAVPFSSQWIISDFDLGIFFLLAVESLIVVGIVMSGWASNNKWSLFGGMRSAAQIVSYEVPVSMTILMVVMWSGTMSLQGLIQAQGAMPWDWHIFQTPFMFVGFFILFIGTLAEGNRMPFDLPEAESELVSGFNTEYSGFRFILFFFAEFTNLYMIGAMAVILFLGGWQAGALPGFVIGLLGLQNTLAVAVTQNLIEMMVFQLKVFAIVFVIIQLRWTLPRVRVDQLMNLCWKYLVPACFVNLLAMSLWMIFVPAWLTEVVSVLVTLFAMGVLGLFGYRVVWQLKKSGAKIRMNPMS